MDALNDCQKSVPNQHESWVPRMSLREDEEDERKCGTLVVANEPTREHGLI